MNSVRYVISCAKNCLNQINVPNTVAIAEELDIKDMRSRECNKIINEEGFDGLLRQPVVGIQVGDYISVECDEYWFENTRDYGLPLTENIIKVLNGLNYQQKYDINQLREGVIDSIIFCAGKMFRDIEISNAIILSGSFRPLHIGHKNLLRAAGEFFGVKTQIFEISLQNADKGIVNDEDLILRLKEFTEPVMLTNRSLFVHKSFLFRDSVFVVGYDTIIRILNPIYYSDADSLMMAMGQIKARGNKFLVAGRLVNGEYKEISPDDIPNVLNDMIIALPEFREDISSTEIRQQLNNENNR